jgi:hypothetical protein
LAEVPYSGIPSVAPDRTPPDDYQRISPAPDSFGGAVGKGLQEAGQGVEKASDNLFNIAQFQNKINGDYAVSSFIDDHNKIIWGDPSTHKQGPDGQAIPDTGFMGLTGADALRQREATLKALEDRRKQGEASLSSPAAKYQYNMATRRLMNETEARIGQHADQQNKVYATEVNTSIANQNLEGIARNAGDTPIELAARKNNTADLIHARVQEAQVKYGNDPAILSDAIARAKQEAAKTWIQAVGATDPDRALKLADTYKGDLGTQYHEVRAPLQAKARTQNADTKADKYWNDSVSQGVQIANSVPAATAAFIQQRSGGARVQGLNPQFATSLEQAARDFEEQNPGRRAAFESLTRTRDEQAAAYNRYRLGQGGLAAPPGQSRHEYGLAADIPDGAFLNWLHSNADKYGLAFLPGKSFESDPGHVQLAGGLPQGAAAPSAMDRAGNRYGPTTQASTAPMQPGIVPIASVIPTGPAAAPLPTVTLAPASPVMPVPSATPTLGTRYAEAMQGILSDPSMDSEERHLAEQKLTQRYQAATVAENQRTADRQEAANHAAGGYTTEMFNMEGKPNQDWYGLFHRVNADPALADHPSVKTALLDRITARSGANEVLTYGPQFLAVKEALLSAPGSPGHIGNFTDIYRLPPGSLTTAGEKELSTVFAAIKKSPDEYGLQRARAGLEKSAYQRLSNEAIDMPGGMKIPDRAGEAAFNSRFLPEWNSAYSKWVSEGKDPWEFLTEKKMREFTDRIRSQAEKNAAFISGVPGASVPEAKGAPLPEAPEGLNREGWNQVVSAAPTGTNHTLFGKAVEALAADPSSRMQAKFERVFPEFKATQVLQKLGVNPEIVAAITHAENQTQLGQEQRFPPTHPTEQRFPPEWPAGAEIPPAAAPEAPQWQRQAGENVRARAEGRPAAEIPIETPEQRAKREGRQESEARDTAAAMREGFGNMARTEPEVHRRMIEGERKGLQAELAELDKNEKEARESKNGISELGRRAIERQRARLKARLEALP